MPSRFISQVQLKEDAKIKRQAAARRNNPRFKAELRRLFVQKARSYLGVPYAKRSVYANLSSYTKTPEGGSTSNGCVFRFHDPEHCTCEGCDEKGDGPERAEQVGSRRCVADLKDQFGFKLGGGNQCYQFDTLPVRVDSIDQLEYGDLIFYEGKYYDKNAKVQKHDMVHGEWRTRWCMHRPGFHAL
eukprot:1188645-Prorocentrum_minimum.AAC.4